MPNPFATWQDVQELWRPLSDVEQARVTARIKYASAMVRTLVPRSPSLGTVDDRIASGDLDADVVRGVVVDMVLAVLGNPDHKITESSDDYSFRRADDFDGSLRLTATMLQTLTAVEGGTAVAWSMVLDQESTAGVVAQVADTVSDYTYASTDYGS